MFFSAILLSNGDISQGGYMERLGPPTTPYKFKGTFNVGFHFRVTSFLNSTLSYGNLDICLVRLEWLRPY